MARHPHAKRRRALSLELFESRLLLSGTATSLTIPLDPIADQFGNQIQTVQAFQDSSGDPPQVTTGIFDTGSSVVSFSAADQANFSSQGTPIPIKVSGGGSASGIGGDITGDVSEPGTILADGIHAETTTYDEFGFPVSVTATFGPDSASVGGVQALVGTDPGSPDLPTVTGTPVLSPTSANPAGLAALIDMQGFKYDFSDILPGLTYSEPDLHFVSPSTTLSAVPDVTTDPVTIPLVPIGDSNVADPGNDITAAQNSGVAGVTVDGGNAVVPSQTFLFDTGSQLTVISTAEANQLGLDLNNPDTTIQVQGVGGTVNVPGFTLPELTVPLTDGGTLTFTNVPVFVLDAAPGVVDGILGMNLFDNANELLYDPNASGGPTLGVTFNTSPSPGLDSGVGMFETFAGHGMTATATGKDGIAASANTTPAVGVAGRFVVIATPPAGPTAPGHPVLASPSTPAPAVVPVGVVAQGTVAPPPRWGSAPSVRTGAPAGSDFVGTGRVVVSTGVRASTDPTSPSASPPLTSGSADSDGEAVAAVDACLSDMDRPGPFGLWDGAAVPADLGGQSALGASPALFAEAAIVFGGGLVALASDRAARPRRLSPSRFELTRLA